MKKIASIFLLIYLAFLPAVATAAFYEPASVDPLFPSGTYEGSEIQSDWFTYGTGSSISFDYNFITDEADQYGPFGNDDWYGVYLIDANTGSILQFEKIGDVYDSTWYAINGENGIQGPEEDYFAAQTGAMTYIFNLSDTYANTDVMLGIGVFDDTDPLYSSALLIDNIELNSTLVSGGDFETDPFAAEGFFGSDGDPAGLFEWMASGSLSGVTEPGTGNFAYISTYYDELPAAAPAPASILLLASGLIGLVALRRFREWR